MGWGLWVHPAAVFRGFSKGHTDKGIARLDIEKANLLELNLSQLQQLTLNKRTNRSRLFYFLKMLGWSLLSQLIFLLPALLILLIINRQINTSILTNRASYHLAHQYKHNPLSFGCSIYAHLLS
jgi:hypothetical protein